MKSKSAMLVYAALAYLGSLATLLYIMGFLADFGVPKGISDGNVAALWPSILIDAGLIGLFGLHHSITARASFKRWWTRFIPAPIERATYLYMTATMTAGLVYFWQPIPITIWQVQSAWASGVIIAVYVSIWAMMVAATFHFGHFGFFGLTHAWQNFRHSLPGASGMTARYLYALVRHPISLGWMTAPFVTPHLTVGHVVFGLSTIAYIILATPFEEADLIDELGDEYLDYRKRVRAFLPISRQG